MVSAITHTPASGPFALVTTPPRSLSPIVTAGARSSALTRVGRVMSSAATDAASRAGFITRFLPHLSLPCISEESAGFPK